MDRGSRIRNQMVMLLPKAGGVMAEAYARFAKDEYLVEIVI